MGVGVCMHTFVSTPFEPLFCYWGQGALEKGFVVVVIIIVCVYVSVCVRVCMC